ncbi:protein of unknown function [Capnocytophaga haemolytica]|jgi:hypothetical protein bacD2_15070|uniref:DUF4832 domain-containing protein n=1 Tax=Capnocytophaga haemolytica TaxID=45243 RepID=A0AAX2H0Z6_9FLAO|nr:DUF4832 domain-containing protein [Capnocytophaga haemolytica]AMD85860.1 hypothetical protein AXF12_10265 [Capnocytophaga haemolytica]SFO04599.1 protein of unknown function [Capnocytophaga haemolytica]SNV15546.1 Uncharacterised protein [Capnocytophaga haemolytica]
MKKYFIALFSLLALSVSCQTKDDDGPKNINEEENPLGPPPANYHLTKKVVYKPSNDIIVNPERGFLTHQDMPSGNDYVLTTDFVRQKRSEGISLILTIYYMQDFRNKRISEAYLKRIRRNMEAIRNGGAKAVLRFAYTSDENQKPWDAPWSITEQHLEQLRPIINEYSDVICVAEAGFVGVWGEWYYTDNYKFQPKISADYEPRAQVLNKLLEVLPKDRMVCVRYPMAKLATQQLDVKDSITLTTAFDGSKRSRIAFHNDCFLADDDDMGTYQHNQSHRAYVAHETRYVAMGGETCAPSSYAECANALKDFAKYHWSYLNADYNKQVLNPWEGKCMDEVKRRLGYRFVLVDALFNEDIAVGGKLQMELHLKNEGWASPFNPRDVELVLINKKKPLERQHFKLKADPRRWFASKTITLRTELTLSAKLPAGTYELYLNLPDPRPMLKSRPEYSIQTANKGTWDAERGMNKLHSFEIK